MQNKQHRMFTKTMKNQYENYEKPNGFLRKTCNTVKGIAKGSYWTVKQPCRFLNWARKNPKKTIILGTLSVIGTCCLLFVIRNAITPFNDSQIGSLPKREMLNCNCNDNYHYQNKFRIL